MFDLVHNASLQSKKIQQPSNPSWGRARLGYSQWPGARAACAGAFFVFNLIVVCYYLEYISLLIYFQSSKPVHSYCILLSSLEVAGPFREPCASRSYVQRTALFYHLENVTNTCFILCAPCLLEINFLLFDHVVITSSSYCLLETQVLAGHVFC